MTDKQVETSDSALAEADLSWKWWLKPENRFYMIIAIAAGIFAPFFLKYLITTIKHF